MNSNNNYDVIIIGGGPGGSTAAWRLARAGKKTLVIDHAKFPRVKVCAGWITPGALQLLELQPAEYPRTLQRFDGGTVVVDNVHHLTTYGQTASFGVIRQEFDEFLLNRAAAAGAEVRQATRIREFDRSAGGVSVKLDDGSELFAQVLIGAGGSGCPVSRKWGEREKNEDIILAAESETRIGADILKQLTPNYGRVELFPEPDYFGYGWYVAKGDWINIGVGRFKSKTTNFNDDKRRFFDYIKSIGRVKGIEDRLEDFAGHSYKLYDEVPRKLSGDRFMLIGDAGGFASKWAGEGIKPAIQTALYAAETALAALAKGVCDAAALGEYERQCRALYGEQKETVASRLVHKLPDAIKRGLARQVCVRDSLRKKYVFEVAFGFEPVAF